MATKKTALKKKKYVLLCSFLLLGSFYFFLTPLPKNNFIAHQSNTSDFLLKTSLNHDQNIHNKKPEIWITIFIHGIMSIKNHLSIPNFIKLMQDDVDNTLYSNTIALMREDDFFFKNQAMQEYGLKKINIPESAQNKYAAGALAYLFDHITKKVDPQKDIHNLFYTFGWVGTISHKERMRAGKELYDALKNEISRLKSNNIQPKIRVIGYSHGGNVALNLAAFHEKDKEDHPFFVDELILIGTPIQCETDHLITSSLFKKIYNVYSKDDRIQILDCFSYKRFFSKRTIHPYANFTIPSKLTQIEIKITSPTTTKKTGIPNACPMVNQSVMLGKSNFLRNRSPGHTELWFFGWTPKNYRHDFPLYPFPIVAFIPYIIKQLQHYVTTCKDNADNSIIVDIRPEYEQIIFRGTKNDQCYMITPFFSNDELLDLYNAIKKYKPENYTKESHIQHQKNAYQKAYDVMYH